MRLRCSSVVVFGWFFTLAVPISAQSANSPDDFWDDRFGFPTINQQIYALAATPNGMIYLGGAFSSGLAEWNGRAWSQFSPGNTNGPGGSVRAIAPDGNALYVGGEFSTAGGKVLNGVGRWTGSNWTALASGLNIGVSGFVYALAWSGSNLFVGGEFYAAGGVSATNVARWDGSQWSALGAGLGDPNTRVTALAIAGDGTLYAGGNFLRSGSTTISRIAHFDGAHWSPLGGGANDLVTALTVQSNHVYAGGSFTVMGGVSASKLAVWNGSNWAQLAGGVQGGDVASLTLDDRDLYVAGSFTSAVPSHVAQVGRLNLDNLGWTGVGGGVFGSLFGSTTVNSILVKSNDVCLAGGFTGTTTLTNLFGAARWDGTNWWALNLALTYLSDAPLAVESGGNLFVAGNFNAAGGLGVNRIAGWDGELWFGLGSGTNNGVNYYVHALAGTESGEVYAGGEFTQAGNMNAQRVARWDGLNWSALGSGIAGGLNPAVRALAVSVNGQVYAGGHFASAGTASVNNIARWDGTNWQALGGGLTIGGVQDSATVYAIATSGNYVYVGGYFNQAGPVAVSAVAAWDGTSWSSLEGGMAFDASNPIVNALTVDGVEVYAGGAFLQAGTVAANNIARWNGEHWFPLGAGAQYAVSGLAIVGSEVFVAGSFGQAGGQNIPGLARWNGQDWSALGSGLGGNSPSARSIVGFGTNLYITGAFDHAGQKSSAHFGHWTLSNSPPTVALVAPPPDSLFPFGTNVSIEADAAGSGGIQEVRFYAGTNLLGVATNSPYLLTWSNVFTGDYLLVASAVDRGGSTSFSKAHNVRVVPPPDNQSPVAAVVSPTNGASFRAGSNVGILVEASDPDGTVTRVDFFDGRRLLGTVTTPPYVYHWSFLPAGPHVLTARATDDVGVSTDSAGVTITGEAQLWGFTTLSEVSSSPAIAPDGTIYFGGGGGDNQLYALNPDRSVKWKVQTSGIMDSSPAIGSNGTVYIGASDRNLYAIKPNGKTNWVFTAGNQIHSSPAVAADGTIYFGCWDYKLYALNPNGTKKWEFLTGYLINSSPAIGGDGTIYVGSYDGKLYAINRDGTNRWSFSIPAGVDSSPAIGADGTIYVGGQDGIVYAMTPNGSNVWQFPTGSAIGLASPVIGGDGAIYIGCDSGKLYALNGDGTLRWRFSTGNEIRSTPAIAADGTIYVGSTDGSFYSLNSGGSLLSRFVTGQPFFSSPAIAADGTVYVGCSDYQFYALVGYAPLAGSSWPMFRKDLQHTANAISLPTVSLTSPSDGAYFTTEQNISVEATASSTNGAIVRIEFYANSNRLAVVTNLPYAFIWTNAPAGIFGMTAKATDLLGATQVSAPVQVIIVAPNTPPSFRVQPLSQTVSNQANVSLSVEVFGSRPFTYQWIKDGETIDGATSDTLILNNVEWEDSAHYLVQVSNATGTATSSVATVTVLQEVTFLWATTPTLQIHSSPAIGQGGEIYFGSDSRNLFAFGSAGAFQWRFETGDYVRSSPAIGADGSIYFGSHDRNLRALRPDGSEKWAFLTEFVIEASPALALDGTIYAASADAKLHAVSTNGLELWSFSPAGGSASSPAIGADGTIYVGSRGDFNPISQVNEGRLHAIGPNGTQQWSFVTSGPIASGPALGSDGTIYFGSGDQNLYALNPDGSLKWKFQTDSSIFSSPALDPDGTVYVGNDGALDPAGGPPRGALHAFTPGGALKWTFPVHGSIRSSPAIAADGTVYFGANDGRFYALNPNGTEKWEFYVASSVESSPAIGFDGTVYFGADDGRLYALGGNSALARSSWPMFRRDLAHTANVSVPRQTETWFFPFPSNAFDDAVNAIAVAGSNVFVGGNFRSAGGIAANYVALWDGQVWRPLGAGVSGVVRALAFTGTDLYVGGSFTAAGGMPASRIARWDGAQWHALGDGSFEHVFALALNANALYASGTFNDTNGLAFAGVGKWDGSQWSPVGDSLNGTVTALAVAESALYAGGGSLGTESHPLDGVAKWDGTNWSALASGLNDRVWTLLPVGSNLYAGGAFSQAGGMAARGIARWDGVNWSPVGGGVDGAFPYVQSLTSAGGGLYVGGSFTVAGGTEADGIARWDGSQWSELGGGVTLPTLTSAVVVNALGLQDTNLFVGGAFLAGGGDRSINYFGKWNGTSWSSVGPLYHYVDGKFQLLLTSQGRGYGLEASSDLLHWVRMTTFTNGGSPMQFLDNSSSKSIRRFYRTVSP